MSKVVQRRQQLAMTEVSRRAEDHQHGRVDGQTLQPLDQRVLVPLAGPEPRCDGRTALHGSRSKAHGRRRTSGLEGRSIGVTDRQPRRAGNSSPMRIARFAFAVAGVGSRRRLGCMSEAQAGKSVATVVRLASSAAVGGFLFGYDSSVINGAVGAIGDHYSVGATGLGFTVSSALLGAAVGAIVAGRGADRFGRLTAMRVAAVLFLISALGSGLVDTLALLIVFRVIGGVGVGMASVIAPAYIAEIAPASIRGRLGSVQQLAIVLGIFVALLADYVLAKVAGGSEHDLALGLEAWRWMFLGMTVPAVLYGGLAMTIPESPRYLVSRMRLDAAKDVLRRVLGSIDVDAKVEEIRQTLSSERPPKLADLRGSALGLMPIVWVGIGLSVFQQFVGINVIFYYSSVLWQAVGFSEN